MLFEIVRPGMEDPNLQKNRKIQGSDQPARAAAKARSRKNAPREREGLFEMVKLFEMVSWPENAILVLILRSAHVQKVPQARTCVARVSKDEDGDNVGALMLRDASQRACSCGRTCARVALRR